MNRNHLDGFPFVNAVLPSRPLNHLVPCEAAI